MFETIDPSTGKLLAKYPLHSDADINQTVENAQKAFESWSRVPFSKRAECFHNLAALLRDNKEKLALLISNEMGKVFSEALEEIEKCAFCCEYYAETAEKELQDRIIETEASKSYVSFMPLGTILAITPWNVPFFQVIRIAAPNLMSGNVTIVKHAPSVIGCSIAIEELFLQAGFPKGVFNNLIISTDQVASLIERPEIKGVTLTGSSLAGRAVAAKAGACLKKTVLELGGSDPYIILEDADLQVATSTCTKSRLLNGGQSCVAAKRFIVVRERRSEFEKLCLEIFKNIKFGPALDPSSQIGPLARTDLRDKLHQQVMDSVKMGATLLCGGEIPQMEGAYYPPTLLANVKPGMPAFDQELFGPAAAIIEAENEEDAFKLANQTTFGLGAAIFSENALRAEALGRDRLNSGQVYINTFVRSDTRLPFGGVNESGYGRELGPFAVKEFINIKTIWVA